MFCNSCGKEIADGAKFCGGCGAVVGAADQGATAGNAAPNYSAPANNAAPAHSAPTQQPVAQKGILATAWNDITSSDGWVKRLFLLMAMNCVPILNLFVEGYLIDWAADAARGNNNVLPKENFDRRIFLKGLFVVILSFLYSIAVGILFFIGMIPFIGAVIGFVISLFTNPILYLMLVRMSVREKFWAAFDMSEIWRRYKTGVGSLVGATFLPAFIINLIFFIIVAIIVGIIIMVTMSGFSSMGYYGRGGFGYMPSGGFEGIFGMLFGAIAVLGIFAVIFVLLFIFINTLASIWTQRAVGIWVSRYAPDWAEDESKSKE